MDLKRLRERKKELNYTNEMISELSGVPLGTVQKVFSGATASPRYSTLVAIEQALYPDKYFYPKIGFGDEAAMYVHDQKTVPTPGPAKGNIRLTITMLCPMILASN